MPILQAKPSASGSNLNWDLSDQKHEAGTFAGILADIIYEENILRPDYNTKELVEKNITKFLFAHYNDDDEIVYTQTYEFVVSVSEKSNMMKMLTNMRGKTPPLDGTYDFCNEIGRKVNMIINMFTSKKSQIEYATVTGVSPLAKKYHSDAPNLDDLEIPSGRRTPVNTDSEKTEKPKRGSRKTAKTVDADDQDPF